VQSKSELSAEVDALGHRLVQGIRHYMADIHGELNGLARSLKEPSMLLGHLVQRVDDLSRTMEIVWEGGMARRGDRLAALRNHLRLKSPALEVARAEEALAAMLARAEHAYHRLQEGFRERIALSAGKLQALSPLATLSRGYAIVRSHPDGEVIRESGQLQAGDRLDVAFRKGGALCVVETTREGTD
jgi:exodeoxyribonuclease VII large subunit